MVSNEKRDMSQNPLFSSISDLWGTSPELFRLLNEVHDFQLDVALMAKKVGFDG